jgi:phosphomannomutase
MASHSKKRVLVLFDIDGTLSPARQSATPEMVSLLEKLRKNVFTGFFFFALLALCLESPFVCVCAAHLIPSSSFFFLISSSSSSSSSGVVGGSDLVKQQEQLRHDALDRFDYNFPENGIVAYKLGHLMHSNSLVTEKAVEISSCLKPKTNR